MKPNIRIVTFLGIQIVRNHIPRNLDAKSNMDFLIHHHLHAFYIVRTNFNLNPEQEWTQA